MTNTPFQTLRSKLREAGCRLECGEQVKTRHGAMVELWLVYPAGLPSRMPVRCMVLDEGEEGYHLFIENTGNSIDYDAQAILKAPNWAGRLAKL